MCGDFTICDNFPTIHPTFKTDHRSTRKVNQDERLIILIAGNYNLIYCYFFRNNRELS